MSDWKAGLVKVPEHMHSAVENYMLYGISPGGFLTAVLSNDLKGAYGRADYKNAACLRDWVDYVYWDMPMAAQGSTEKVEVWMAHRGLSGIGQAQEVEADNAADTF